VLIARCFGFHEDRMGGRNSLCKRGGVAKLNWISAPGSSKSAPGISNAVLILEN
jgi:hypothetical protein